MKVYSNEIVFRGHPDKVCDQINRKATLMELDEKYVDVIVNRYLAHKGTKENCYLLRDGKKISLFDIEELG